MPKDVRGSLPLKLPEESKWILQLAKSMFPKTFGRWARTYRSLATKESLISSQRIPKAKQWKDVTRY
jgi:hypothetical protein